MGSRKCYVRNVQAKYFQDQSTNIQKSRKKDYKCQKAPVSSQKGGWSRALHLARFPARAVPVGGFSTDLWPLLSGLANLLVTHGHRRLGYNAFTCLFWFIHVNHASTCGHGCTRGEARRSRVQVACGDEWKSRHGSEVPPRVKFSQSRFTHPWRHQN